MSASEHAVGTRVDAGTLGAVNYTLAVGGIAILLSWVIIFSTGSGHIYLSDRLESIKKDIAEQEELRRKELLKNTRAHGP